jgi:hypothetical protein
MPCPTCNAQNTATAVRCIQCGTTLIYEAEGHSDTYKKAAGGLDNRMYGGIGSFLGFCLVLIVLKFVLSDLYLEDRQIYGGAIGGAFAGGILGRLIAWSKWRYS